MALDTPKENPAYPSEAGTPPSAPFPTGYGGFTRTNPPIVYGPRPHHTPAITGHAPDMVNHPPHYRLPDGSEAIDHIKAALTKEQLMGYYKGNALKYTLRAERKGGAEDFKKAAWYLKAAAELI